ncbi:T-cell immunoglobulin and mucin domain-containing protein 4-like isoform X2 [Kryptolebias marmoratus]|uniref:T-cell immunoglobulin and mucin domain-containing protein 4-like n=1 Tax=Kryptolebias marmoratus TaxID=37003 RepID=A0A3Q3A8R1_KRYMA|nr:T-cell immunoglobulin and mucin domain-containing protein 4-like isoform X2 [Kryptolebias marmoratus]
MECVWREKIVISSLQNMFIRYATHMRGLSLSFLLILIQASSCTIRVTGRIGQNVTLPCMYDAQTEGGNSFCWGHEQVPLFKCSNLVLSSKNGNVVFRKSPKYQLLGRVAEGDFSLTVLDAQRSDAGVYGCRVEVPGLFNDQKVNTELIIEEAPVEQPVTTSDATTKEILTPAPNDREVRESTMEKSVTDKEISETFQGVGNIGRMAVIFFLTIIIILVLIIRRTVLSKEKLQRTTFTDENIYESVSMVR